MNLLPSSSRESTTKPQVSRLLRLTLPVLMCVLLLAVVGTILANVSPPGERDITGDAITVTALDLTAGDVVHNQAMQTILLQLEKDGYQINGNQPIAEDRWSALRGRQSVMSPHASQVQTEWRLAVSAHRKSLPHSFVAMRVPDEGLSPRLVKAIEEEWLQYSTALPPEVVSVAQDLLSKVAMYADEDREAISELPVEGRHDGCVVFREWRIGGMNSSDTDLHYHLRLKQATARYEVAVELHNEQDSSGNACGCWLCIDFIRLANTAAN